MGDVQLPFDFAGTPHRRRNPLSGEWIVVSPQRLQRPWQGRLENTAAVVLPQHDATCYLCPGNARAGGVKNPVYTGTYVFENDFPALLTSPGEAALDWRGILRAEQVWGVCHVLCFSPRHDLTMAEMDLATIRSIVDLWCAQTTELSARRGIQYVQIFENKGELMGCSNPHPHGQLWATNVVPSVVKEEDKQQHRFFEDSGGRRLLHVVAEQEERLRTRLVVENAHWLALVPFWAKWPFETIVLPRTNVANLGELDAAMKDDLARVLSELTIRYDNLFETSFPYTMGIHQAPIDPVPSPHWTLHLHFYPPLLRSASIQKFMVGYELLAESQRDLSPEEAAARLREVPLTHYRTGRRAGQA